MTLSLRARAAGVRILDRGHNLCNELGGPRALRLSRGCCKLRPICRERHRCRRTCSVGSPDNVFALLGVTTAAVVISIAVFLGSIERGHAESFCRPMSCQQQMAQDWPRYSTRARIKLITSRDPVFWPRGAVRVFIATHWAEWEADPPDWFADPRWRAALPKECMPDKEAQQAAHLQQTA